MAGKKDLNVLVGTNIQREWEKDSITLQLIMLSAEQVYLSADYKGG